MNDMNTFMTANNDNTNNYTKKSNDDKTANVVYQKGNFSGTTMKRKARCKNWHRLCFLTWHTRWNVSLIRLLYFTYPSAKARYAFIKKRPCPNKIKLNLEGDCADLASITEIQSGPKHFFFFNCQLNEVATAPGVLLVQGRR